MQHKIVSLQNKPTRTPILKTLWNLLNSISISKPIAPLDARDREAILYLRSILNSSDPNIFQFTNANISPSNYQDNQLKIIFSGHLDNRTIQYHLDDKSTFFYNILKKFIDTLTNYGVCSNAYLPPLTRSTPKSSRNTELDINRHQLNEKELNTWRRTSKSDKNGTKDTITVIITLTPKGVELVREALR